MAAPFGSTRGLHRYDGQLLPWAEAKLHVLSHGLHYASAVFEGERAYGGQIFKSTEHSERLKRSANLLDFENSPTRRRRSTLRNASCWNATGNATPISARSPGAAPR